MDDATPSATPMPAQPVDTVTSTEAPFPPADPLPAFVPPAVTDPVSNLDFLPVDDAFALEMRSETIEQLVGGDALRRGESERIEAGRSQTNADLVAGRDRVRVHGTLHEHTGHGLAEQAAHLHTTVDGTLDVHAGNEDTVLLAGHMHDLWDGGAAIVAAMTDDTVAGGGIRVTTPLDLWMHGLMGVEERIGTCTADAVLTESSATHYEREYGPGAHAAGLAVYTGSLYQSSRSSFRPLMRVSSGVRNLIAAGDGGGAGSDAGAGGAPAASPPPATAQTGAAAKSVTGTLATARRTAEVPATTLDAADALTDARRVPLEELVDSVDARAAEEMGEARIAMRAEDLPELTRCAGTAEQLGALRETLRIDKTASGSEAAGGSRASELAGAVSMHPASGGGGPLEIDPSSAVHGENARIVRPHPDVAWGQGQVMQPGLPGGADRPPPSAATEADFHAAYRRLRERCSHYYHISRMDIRRDYHRVIERFRNAILGKFIKFGGNTKELAHRPSGTTQADQAYDALHEMARRAERNREFGRAGEIREALGAFDKGAVEALQALTTKHGIPETAFIQAVQQPPAAVEPTMAVTAIPPPAHTPGQTDWIAAYRQLRGLTRQYSNAGQALAYADARVANRGVVNYVAHRLTKFGGDAKRRIPHTSDATRLEQAYGTIQGMLRQAEESHDAARADPIREALEQIRRYTTRQIDKLARKYGALDTLSTQAMLRPPATAGPPVTVASTTVPPPSQFDIPGPAYPIVAPLNPAYTESAGGLMRTTDVPSPCAVSGLPGPSHSEATVAEAGDLGRWWLHRPATVSGATAAQPAATGNIVTPALGGTSSFWLQPVDPVRAPVSVPFDSGPHHAGETVQPPPVTTTASSTAPVLDRGAAFTTPSRVDDDVDIQRALRDGRLPPGFNASPLIAEARTFAEPGLADELAARRLPLLTIDVLIDGYRANDEGGGNAPYIERLLSLRGNIEHALHDAYPGRVDPRWLDQTPVLELMRRRGEPAAPSAASATVPAELDVAQRIERHLGTVGDASHPAPLPPPSAAGRIGAGAEAPPPAADPWRIRPPGMGGEPHPVAFDPRSAPPGPSSQVGYTRAIRTPVMSTGAPPGWQGAGTPGFARAASGAVALPFSRREEIAIRFGTEDALLHAELTVRLGGADALGWSARRRRDVLHDLGWINTIAQLDCAAAAAGSDVDWRAIEELMRILDAPPPAP